MSVDLDPRVECPNRQEHYNGTDEPYGYIGWHAWAEKKNKTHKQVRCSSCNRWSIWVHR